MRPYGLPALPGAVRHFSRVRSLRPPRRYASTSPTPDPNALFHIPPPPPRDFPPISQRLKPLVPFLIYWTALTSLAFHLLRVRKEADEQMERKNAQISVLEGLIRRLRQQGTVDEIEMNRELEMVGLRKRKEGDVDEDMREAGNVGWREVLLGRKRVKRSEEEQEKVAADEWRAGESEERVSGRLLGSANSDSPV